MCIVANNLYYSSRAQFLLCQLLVVGSVQVALSLAVREFTVSTIRGKYCVSRFTVRDVIGKSLDYSRFCYDSC